MLFSKTDSGSDAELRRQLDRIESMLRAIMSHLDVSFEEARRDGVSESVSESVRRLVRQGKKIEAIKLYREATGLGLAEAKAAVERL